VNNQLFLRELHVGVEHQIHAQLLADGGEVA
jgi:hypothetical protein